MKNECTILCDDQTLDKESHKAKEKQREREKRKEEEKQTDDEPRFNGSSAFRSSFVPRTCSLLLHNVCVL